MKKSLLLSFALAATLSASAATQTFGFCGNPNKVNSLENQSSGNYVRQGAKFDNAYTTTYAGCKITAINICSGHDIDKVKNNVTNIKVFLTDNMEGEPFYTQEAQLSTDPLTWNKIALETPYTIEADKPFYYGYEFTIDSGSVTNFSYIISDGYKSENTNGSWIVSKVKGEYTLQNYAPIGGNVCVDLDLEGEFTIGGSASVASHNLSPLVNLNTPFQMSYDVKNSGTENLTSYSAEISIDGTVVETQDVDLAENPLKPNEVHAAKIDLTFPTAAASTEVSINITKANGQDNRVSDGTNQSTKTTRVLGKGEGFARNIVVEEGTGTWCPWCPAGIVLFEYARKKFTDGSVILIAVHSNDEMSFNAYKPFFNYISGFPGYSVNRETPGSLVYDKDEDMEYLESVYNNIRKYPTIANIKLKAQFTAENRRFADCTATVEFSEPSNTERYKIAYVLIEDNVGPFKQYNGFNGMTDKNLDDWGSSRNPREWYFNDIARNIINFRGVDGSIPSVIETGVEYEHKQQIKVSKGINPDNVRIAAMIIDNNTGYIINATETTIDMPSAIETVFGENDSDLAIEGTNGEIAIIGDYNVATIYNLDGTVVATAAGEGSISVPAGIYVVKADNAVSKVIVK